MPFVRVLMFRQKQVAKNSFHQILLLYKMDTEMTKHILSNKYWSTEPADIWGYRYSSKLTCLEPGLDYCAIFIHNL